MLRFLIGVALLAPAGMVSAQDTEAESESESESESEAESEFRYRGIGVQLGLFGGSTTERGSFNLGSRISLTVPLLDFMRFEATGESWASSKGNGEDEYAAAILHGGVRLAPWRIGETVEPYLSVRLCHMHEATRSSWQDHFFANVSGSSDHGLGHRSGSSFEVGIDAPLLADSPQWRIGGWIELITMFDAPVVYLHAGAFLGYGF